MTGRIQSQRAAVKSHAIQDKARKPAGWGDMRHINQLRPQGANAEYVNAAYNCGPAAVAMVARGWGKKSHLNDAQLITHLAKGNVTQEGTTPQGIASMLERANVPIAGKAHAGRFDNGYVKDHLKKGHTLIAQVAITDKKTGERSPHYVVVRKMTEDGKYVVSDPLKKKSSIVTAEQLGRAVNRAPPDGGVLIPVGRPGGDLKPSTPPHMSPMGPVDPMAFQSPMGWRAYVAGQPFQDYPSVRAMETGQRGGYEQYPSQFDRGGPVDRTQYRDSLYGGGHPLGASADGYSMRDGFTGGPQLVRGANGLYQPAPQPAAPAPKPVARSKADKNAFTASDDEFVGVKGDFVQQPIEGAAPTATGDKKKGKAYRLDLSYQRHGKEVEKPTRPVTPWYKSVDGYARSLLRAKARGQEGISERLHRLELSPFERDRKVLARMEYLEKKQGGIGKRVNWESIG
jgi:hypothetical protein